MITTERFVVLKWIKDFVTHILSTKSLDLGSILNTQVFVRISHQQHPLLSTQFNHIICVYSKSFPSIDSRKINMISLQTRSLRIMMPKEA